MEIDKNLYPEVLTFVDVSDVLNDVNQQQLQILDIKKHGGSVLSFESQMQSAYRNLPLIYQPGDIRTELECKTDWKNKFLMIFNSAKAQFMIKKIELQQAQLTNLANLDIWKDETKTNSVGSTTSAGSTNTGVKSETATATLETLKTAHYQTDSNSVEEISAIKCAEVTLKDGEKVEAEYEITQPNYKTTTKNKNNNIGLISANSNTSGVSATFANNSGNVVSTFSNASKDIREFFNTDLNNYNAQFINLFRELFRWRFTGI